MMIAVLAFAIVGINVVQADDGLGTPDAKMPGHGIVRQLADALLDATANATKLTEADLIEQLGKGKTLTEVITANGATVEAVRSAAKDTVTKQVRQAVTDGKLTQAVADKAIERLDKVFDRLLTAKFPGQKNSAGQRLHNLGYVLLLKETADQTKIAPRDVIKQLRNDKTLEQVAEVNKVNVNAIVTATVKKATDRINTMVKNGKLNEDQAKTLLESLQPELTKMMSEPMPKLGRLGKGSKNSADRLRTPQPESTPGL
jgi:hypothetical protein